MPTFAVCRERGGANAIEVWSGTPQEFPREPTLTYGSLMKKRPVRKKPPGKQITAHSLEGFRARGVAGARLMRTARDAIKGEATLPVLSTSNKTKARIKHESTLGLQGDGSASLPTIWRRCYGVEEPLL